MRRFSAWVALLSLILIGILTAFRVLIPGSVPESLRLSAIDPGTCAMPCWLGIQPGITSMRDAVKLVLNSPFIDPTSIEPLANNAGTSFRVRWKSSMQMLSVVRPAVTDLNISVESDVQGKYVNLIFLYINVPLGEFIERFGQPPRAVLGHEPNSSMAYILEYPDLAMQYMANLECRSGQQLTNVYGSFYILQTPAHFISQVGGRDDLGWHGLSSRAIDTLLERVPCP